MFFSHFFTQCYKFFVGNSKTWQNARSHCLNQRGNLVSILNEKEEGKHSRPLWCFLWTRSF